MLYFLKKTLFKEPVRFQRKIYIQKNKVWWGLEETWTLLRPEPFFQNFWDGFGGWILETHFFQTKIEDQQKSRPNEILMTYGIFSIKPTKWFLGYLTSQKPLESFANMCSLVFIKICWFLIILVSMLRFFKTSRFWKWFQTQMRSWWPMESFLSNQQNDSWGIWHLKSLWNHLQICVLWFSLKSVDLWFFWYQCWGFSKRAVFGNDSKPKWDLDDPWNLFYQTNKMILGVFDISKAFGIICKYVFFGFH